MPTSSPCDYGTHARRGTGHAHRRPSGGHRHRLACRPLCPPPACNPWYFPASVYVARPVALSGGARHDRSRTCAVVLAKRLQPRDRPPANSSDGALAGRDADEDDTRRRASPPSTINAAHSLGHGALPGFAGTRARLADFVIHECDDYRELPYFFGNEPAQAVYVGGEMRVTPPCARTAYKPVLAFARPLYWKPDEGYAGFSQARIGYGAEWSARCSHSVRFRQYPAWGKSTSRSRRIGLYPANGRSRG